MNQEETIIIDSTAIVLEEETPVVLTEEEDEQKAWPIQVQFYFGEGLLGERDADLLASGGTL